MVLVTIEYIEAHSVIQLNILKLIGFNQVEHSLLEAFWAGDRYMHIYLEILVTTGSLSFQQSAYPLPLQ